MPDNRKPLIYGAFPVCRNYTVRAHICNPGFAERCGHQNGLWDARSLLRWIHARHVHPRHNACADQSRRNDGRTTCECGEIKHRGKDAERYKSLCISVFSKNSSRHCDFARNTPIKSFPVLSADIRIWVTVWVSAISAKLGRTFTSHKRRKSPEIL